MYPDTMNCASRWRGCCLGKIFQLYCRALCGLEEHSQSVLHDVCLTPSWGQLLSLGQCDSICGPLRLMLRESQPGDPVSEHPTSQASFFYIL